MTDLSVAIADGVALLTLNRPERRNAYTAEMGAMLNSAYRECDDDDAVRVLVLTGAGNTFCVGADFATEQALSMCHLMTPRSPPHPPIRPRSSCTHRSSRRSTGTPSGSA